MGYDMTIKAVDRQSLLILADVLDSTEEDILVSCMNACYPISYDTDLEAPMTLKEYSMQYKISMKTLLDKVVIDRNCIQLSSCFEVYYSSNRVLRKYFKIRGIKEPDNDGIYILNESRYVDLKNWLRAELSSITLLQACSLVDNPDYYYSLGNLYNSLEKTKIDFEVYTVYFEHNW